MTPDWIISSDHSVDVMLMGKIEKQRKRSQRTDKSPSVWLSIFPWQNTGIELNDLYGFFQCCHWIIVQFHRGEKKRKVQGWSYYICYTRTHTHTLTYAHRIFMHEHHSHLLFSQLLNFNFISFVCLFLLSSYDFNQLGAID